MTQDDNSIAKTPLEDIFSRRKMTARLTTIRRLRKVTNRRKMTATARPTKI